MKISLYSIFYAAILVALLNGCGDNYNPYYLPTDAERYVEIVEILDNKDNNIIHFDAARSDKTVKVASNTRWAVEITGESGWCDVDIDEGKGDGEFTINVSENMRSEDRSCVVWVKLLNVDVNEKTPLRIDIVQDKFNVSFSPASFEPFPSQFSAEQNLDVKSNVAWTISVRYDDDNATRFVNLGLRQGFDKVEAVGGSDMYKGTGDAGFTIRLEDNRTLADRTAYIDIESENSRNSIMVLQQAAEYSFDVSPTVNQRIANVGGEIKFSVLSLVPWSVDSAADWIEFSKKTGEGTPDKEEITVRVIPNSYGVERTGQIKFQPSAENFKPVTVDVIQDGFDMTFSMNPYGSLGVVKEGGETRTLTIDSRFDWKLRLPSWISASMPEGQASESVSHVDLTIVKNTNGDFRIGTIELVPQPTVFPGNVIIDPSGIAGVNTIQLGVTQYGGEKPALSEPWVVDGYGQRYATIRFNYYSPFHSISEAGVKFRETDGSSWRTVKVATSNGKEGKVSVDLSGLEPATRYEVYSFITYDGVTQEGIIPCVFTTAGELPDEGDNPMP